MSNVEIFESLIEQGMVLPIGEQAKYINQTFTGKLLRSLQTDEFRYSTVSIKRAVQLIGPHLATYSPNKRANFLQTVTTFPLEKSDFELIFTNLPNFKISNGNLIRSAYNQHGINFATTMAKISKSRNVLFIDLFESLIDIDESDRDRLFMEFPDSIRLPHRTTSLSFDEIKRGVYKTENLSTIKGEILKTLDQGTPFKQLLNDIEEGRYLPNCRKDFLVEILLSISSNQAENISLINDFTTRLEIHSSQLDWIRLANECTNIDEVPTSTLKNMFVLLMHRDIHVLQNWFETFRISYPENYWKLFDFKGVVGEAKSLALFRALAQHLCYTRDAFEFSPGLESERNLNNLTTKLSDNYLSFVQESQYTHSFSLLMKFVASFAQFGNTTKVIQLGHEFALRNGQVELLANHDEYLIELCICHCKEYELDRAFEIYKKLSDFNDPSYSYLEFLLCDLARDISALDVSLFVFNRHLTTRKNFDNRVLTSIFRSYGFFYNFKYQSISIFKDLVEIGQQFDGRSLHALVEAVRFACDLNELENLVSEIATTQTSTPSEVFGELMFSYLHHNQSDNALEVLNKIASIDGYRKAEAKYGSLLATYDIPVINEAILRWATN